MSAEANVALIRQAYSDFKAGNLAAVLDNLTDDVQWITPGAGLPTAGRRHGKAEVAAFFQVLGQTWDLTAFEPRQFIASGDLVVALGSTSMVARATGKAASLDWAMVFQLRDGKVAVFQEMTDTLAAAQTLRAQTATA